MTNSVFTSLPNEVVEKIEASTKTRDFADGQFLLVENEIGTTFFMIEEGSVEIIKDQVSLGTLQKGDILGESALAGKKRNASARAKGAVRVLEINLLALRKSLTLSEFTSFKNVILEKEIDKMTTVNQLATLSLKQNFEDLKTKENMATFLIYILAFIFIYVFVIQAVTVFKLNIVSSSIISIPILFLLGSAMYLMMKRSGYPLATYGLTLKGWKNSLMESFFFTIPILVFLVILKWVLIHTVQRFSHLELFHVSPALQPGQHVSHIEGAILVMAYALFVPVQELVFRGAIQSSLQQFLSGKKRHSFAIFVSNIPFAMIHFHLSLMLVILVYFMGAYWGWMYGRQKTLVGAIFSHFIVGLFGFFILGIQDILVK
ncbi:MAG: cyclic nucleotide-binding domain-containing protein [Verrucomicrobia bacterium]|nr:cyclic nucleotide-binding domain-containing protein [Verrucomicrobiota bacterium]